MAIRRNISLAGLALAGALLAALPAPAYLIILKDGSRIESADKPVAQGRNYVFRDKLGAKKMVAISEVDPAKTEAANKENFRDAYILGEPEPMKRESDNDAKAPSLSEYIKQTQRSDITAPTPTPHVVPGEARSGSAAQRPLAAAVAAAPSPAPLLDPIVQEAFLRAYQSTAVRGTRITQADAGTIRVQTVTDSEAIVFGALVGTARGLKEARTAGRLVEKVELYMATSAGENAGRFLITPDDAEALLNGTIPPARFFVANVEL
ncbi:MAG: hypothetical protein KJ062_18700 [Thermoanaerobaculia bacterium]|nr:hypothetical protein [Thermoanaerobaculia bacterium]